MLNIYMELFLTRLSLNQKVHRKTHITTSKEKQFIMSEHWIIKRAKGKYCLVIVNGHCLRVKLQRLQRKNKEKMQMPLKPRGMRM